MRINIPQEIPGRTRPLGHGVRFPLGRATAAGTGSVHPVRYGRQRRFSIVGGLIGLHLRQGQGQLTLVNGHKSALFTFHNGNRFPPVTLPGEHPIPQFEVGLTGPDAFLLQECYDLLLGIRHGQTV